MEQRYYYTDNNGNYGNYKSPQNIEGFVEITKEEYDEHFQKKEVTPPTSEEIQNYNFQIQINFLKSQLQSTDYKVIKYMEGQLSEEEYLTLKAERQAWRDKINQLEDQLNTKKE